MSLVIQPTIQGVLTEFLSAGLLILVGIFLEYKKQDRASVAFTIIGLIVMAFTTQLDWLVLPIFVFYSVIGILFAVFNVKALYGVFGSKVYGSLMFSVAIFHIPSLQNRIYEVLFSPQMTEELLKQFLTYYYVMVVVVWIIVAIFVWVLGKRVIKKIKG